MADDETAPQVLRCPECVGGEGQLARIGNRKTRCGTCNRFAQSVRRLVARRLTDAHPEQAARLRESAEREVYVRLVGDAVGLPEPSRSRSVGSTDGEARS